MTIRFCLVLFFLALTAGAGAQTVLSSLGDTSNTSSVHSGAGIYRAPVIKPKKPKAISREFNIGAALTTDGWGLSVTKGWVKSKDQRNSDKFYNTRFVQIEFLEHKHPKETKTTNSVLSQYSNEKPKPFIFGKVNNFYSFKLAYGYRRMIAGKPEPGTISIHWMYAGGLSVGLLKPYYVDAFVASDTGSYYTKMSIKYGEDTKRAFLAQPLIIGSSGWSKGLNEIQVVPGIHAKTGLHFDFAASAKSKLAVEVGLAGELFIKKIEIMAEQKSYPFVINGYLSLQFGRRK